MILKIHEVVACGGGQGSCLQRGTRKVSVVMETFFILLVVMDACLYTLLPVHVTVVLKYMHFIESRPW